MSWFGLPFAPIPKCNTTTTARNKQTQTQTQTRRHTNAHAHAHVCAYLHDMYKCMKQLREEKNMKPLWKGTGFEQHMCIHIYKLSTAHDSTAHRNPRLLLSLLSSLFHAKTGTNKVLRPSLLLEVFQVFLQCTLHRTEKEKKDMTRVEKFCVEGIEKASETAMEGARM